MLGSFTRCTFSVLAMLALATAVRADLTNNFSSNPLTDPGVLKQGPDAANASSRFTYNSADGTLTAHYDTAEPTIKLAFPLPGGQHVDQTTSFSVSTTFKILSGTFTSPPDFGGSVPAFGLINSATTGNQRASTGYSDSSFNFVEVTPGTAYDMMTFDYFPTLDQTFGGNSLSLTAVHSAESGVSFNNSFSFGFANATLPLDQFITTTISYNAGTHMAHLDWGTGLTDADLTGAVFNMDSFGITLWNDPNLTAVSPAVPAGSRVAGDVVFDSFAVQVAAPEPASLVMMCGGVLMLIGRRRKGI